MTERAINTLRKWTAQQAAAIAHGGGDFLVSAAAGSGKTAVLAERCARLVCDGMGAEACGVENLLVLTFTEAAASEMRARIVTAIGERAKGGGSPERLKWLRRQAAMAERASISTLHAFCARVLRQHFHEAQLDPGFTVMDEDEGRLVREEALDEVMARWHEKPLAAADEFYESYAQGSEGTCRGMILQLHRMLESTADPAGYLAGARRVYGEGRRATVDYFLMRTLHNKVRVAALAAERAAAVVEREVGPGQMLTAMQGARAALVEAAACLGRGGFEGARTALAFEWPARLASVKGLDNFEVIKKRTYKKIKDVTEKLREEWFVVTPAEMERELTKLGVPLEVLLRLTEEFGREYATAKRAQNSLDFADLERLTLNLLTMKKGTAVAELRKRYRYLLVDEFQDINPLQAALLEAVRSAEAFEGRGNLFVVGDVKQSIYGFRLAEPGLFLKREQAAKENVGKEYVTLPHNFRSRAKLLAAMNGVFEKLLTQEVAEIRYREGHALEAAPGQTEETGDEQELTGGPMEVLLLAPPGENEEEEPVYGEEEKADAETEEAGEQLSSTELEARMVAARVAALLKENRTVRGKDGRVRPLMRKDIAILLRSMKDKALLFARALSREGIAVHADLSSGYFDAPEVREALALLEVLDNPRQDIALATVLLGPYGGFSHDDLAVLRLTYDRKRVTFSMAAVRYAVDGKAQQLGGEDAGREPPAFDEGLAARLSLFHEKVAGWRELLRTRPLHEGLGDIFESARIMAYLAGLEGGEQRIANLQALHQRALKFAGFRKQGLHRFLRFIERLRDQEADFGEAPVLSEASDVVRIMSVHKSKGLEFPVVVVPGLGWKLTLNDKGPVQLHRDLHVGLHVADVGRNIYYASAASANIMEAAQRTRRAEELRLFYVALTRARDHLILTGRVTKAERIEEARAAWVDHEGPLPEDLLTGGATLIDWVLPALANAELRVQWPGDAVMVDAQVVVTMPVVETAALVKAEKASEAEEVQRLLAGERVALPGEIGEEVRAVVGRLTRTYTHAGLAAQPAVVTVSQLKKREAEAEREEEEFAAVPVFGNMGAGAEEAQLRGTATHRLLECVDFVRCGSAEEIAAQVVEMTASGKMTAEQAAAADVAGVVRFFMASATGKRVRAAAADATVIMRRELPFVWAAPVLGGEKSNDPADWPTVRGVIDLLIMNRTTGEAEIIDYKTDSERTWRMNLEAYERQMGYYLRAAGEILGKPPVRATLVFLSVAEEIVVNQAEGIKTCRR